MSADRKSATPATARVQVNNTRKVAGAGPKSEIAPLDVEGLAVADARAVRIALAEREVQQALAPICKRYRVRLGTVQLVVDGIPQPVEIRVMADD